MSAHLPAALVLCASVAAPLATTDGTDVAVASGVVRWSGAEDAALEAPVARPVFVTAERGPSAVVRGAAGQELGWTRDQVLDRATGRVTHVVLETAAGRTVAVPAARFEWDPRKKELWLAAGPAELAEGSEFDPAELQRLEGPAWNVAGVFQAGRTSSREEAPRSSCPSLLASEVAARPVTAAEPVTGDERVVGVVDALLLDPRRCEVAYVLVAPLEASAERVPVPWSALALGQDGTLGLDPASLDAAPTVPVDLHPLGNPDFLATVERVWRTTDPRPAH